MSNFLKLFFYTVVLVLLSSLSYAASEKGLGFQASGFYYSESFTLKQILNDLEGGSEPAIGNKAFGKLSFGVEYWSDNHSISLSKRRETRIDYSQGIVDYLFLDKNDKSFPDNGFYDVSLHVKDMQFDQVKYRYQWQANSSLNVWFGVGVVSVFDIIYGDLNGYLSSENAFAGQDFSWDAELNYSYREDHLLELQSDKDLAGVGVTSSVDLGWCVSDHWKINVAIDDLWSWIKIRQAPYTDVVSVANNKISVRQPALEGHIGKKDLFMSLSPYVQLRSEYELQPGAFFVITSESLFGQEFNSLGGKISSAWGIVGAVVGVETHALTLEFKNEFVELALMSDTFSRNTARILQLGMTLSASF